MFFKERITPRFYNTKLEYCPACETVFARDMAYKWHPPAFKMIGGKALVASKLKIRNPQEQVSKKTWQSQN